MFYINYRTYYNLQRITVTSVHLRYVVFIALCKLNVILGFYMHNFLLLVLITRDIFISFYYIIIVFALFYFYFILFLCHFERN